MSNLNLKGKISYSVSKKALFSVVWCLGTGPGKGAAGGGLNQLRTKATLSLI